MKLSTQLCPLEVTMHSFTLHNAPLAIARIFDNAMQVHKCIMQNGYLSCPFHATVV